MSGLLSPVLRQLNRASGVFKRRKLLFCTASAAIAAIALVGFNMLWGAKKTEGGYITSTVKKGTVTNAISASGAIEPVSTVSLSFKNSEMVKKIYVKVGDHVTAGQLLAEQDSSNLEAQVKQTEASLKGAVAKLGLITSGAGQETNAGTVWTSYDLAKANLERYQKLYQAGAVSLAELESAQKEFISAESEMTSATAQVESYRAQLQMAQDDLLGARMVSPINGIVSVINGAEGQRATANNNNTSSSSGFIVVISEALQVKAQVNEADIGRLALGQKVEFTVNAFPNKTFTGKVGSISPQAETVSNVQIYNAVIQIDENQQGLKAGMPANVTVIVDKQENILTIPKSAVTFATNYLSKMKQNVSDQAQPSAAGGSSGGITAGAKGSGGTDSGSVSGTGASRTAKESDQKRQSVVLILDKSGNPVPRQVVLGISDQKNYAVLEGLNEGDTVIVSAGGASSTGAGTNTSSKSNSKSSGSPLVSGGGGPPPP